MIHPSIDLDKITSDLESIGFEAVTKLLFRRYFVDIEVKDGIIPDGAQDLCTPFFRVKIYSLYTDKYLQFDCDATELSVFVNSDE